MGTSTPTEGEEINYLNNIGYQTQRNFSRYPNREICSNSNSEPNFLRKNKTSKKTKKDNSTFYVEGNHYTCSLCSRVPEIIDVHSDTHYIDLKCKVHGIMTMGVEDYFMKEEKYINYNVKCFLCQRKLKKCNNKNFKYCCECHKQLCFDCYEKHLEHHKTKCFSIREETTRCLEHFEEGPFEFFCTQCEENVCTQKLSEHSEHETNIVRRVEYCSNIEKRIQLIEEKNKNLNYIIGFNKIIIDTYKKYPNNYFNCKNVYNLADSIEKEENRKKLEIIKKEIDTLQSRANYQLKVFQEFKNKFNKEIKGNEESLFLNDLGLDDNDLKLLVKIPYTQLKFLNLNGNNIKDISPLKDLKAPLLERLEMNSNKIEVIDSLKEISDHCKEIKIIGLRNNLISNIDCLNQENILPKLENMDLMFNNFLSQCKNIGKIIDQYENKITYIPLKFDDFYKKYNLENVDFQKTKELLYLPKVNIGDEGLKSLYYMDYNFNILIELYLSDDNITNISIMRWFNFDNLQKMDLSCNLIQDISPFNEIYFPELKNLYLHHNQIRNISVFQNVNYPRLLKIDLDENPINYRIKENADSIGYLEKQLVKVIK